MNKFGILNSLKNIEIQLAKDALDESDLNKLWGKVPTHLNNTTDFTIAYQTAGGKESNAKLTIADIKDVQKKLLPKFKFTILAGKYKQIATDKGTPYDFPLQNIQLEKKSISIPIHFR